jgi:hypothetical protein
MREDLRQTWPFTRSRIDGAGGLYSLFGSAGAMIDVVTVITLALLTYLVREYRRPGVMLALSAALLFAIGLLLCWVLVYPVDVELPNG